MKGLIKATNVEHRMKATDFIVSKTDLKGRITYANRIFMQLGQYPITSLLKVQHNIIRHPDMPRGVFRLLWESLKQGDEFFGFIKNMCANGDHYWVFANVTPDMGVNGKVMGYYSVRRKPSDAALDTIKPIYKEMLSIEKRFGAREGIDKSISYLGEVCKEQDSNYTSYILDLYKTN